MIWRRVLLAWMVAAGVAASAQDALAQARRFALVVEGASGTPEYAALHREWLDQLVALLRDRFQFEANRVIVLADALGTTERRATADDVRTALAEVAAEAGPGDLLFVMLIGHGSGQGTDAKFNLIGPDLSPADWQALLEPVLSQMVIVDATGASFPYLAGLAGPNRVIITATNSYAQRFHTEFAGAFIEALGADEADLDKNARVSLLEAFSYASRLVGEHYEQSGQMQTEHAALDDTGDGEGRIATSEGPDGELASVTYLDAGPLAAASSAPPELRPLVERQVALMQEVEELLRRRHLLPDDFYAQEFERLMIDLSLVSRDIRRRQR